VTLSTVPLAFGLACDVFVAATQITHSQILSASIAAGVLVLLLGAWHGLPMLARRRKRAQPAGVGALFRGG
jgi:hypothetical protein